MPKHTSFYITIAYVFGGYFVLNYRKDTMIEVIPNLPDNVAAFKATGEVTKEDYDLVVQPWVNRKIKENELNTFIEMDGGIGLDNIKTISDSGVNVFVAGNSIFGAKDSAKVINEMKQIIK